MSYYKKCLYISGVLIVIGIGLLVFGFLMDGLIISQAKESATMYEESSDLWAYIPGRSNVSIFKIHQFYDVKDIEEVFFNNKKLTVQETGTYSVQEYDEYINRKYSADNKTVGFKFWRYYRNPSQEDAHKQEDVISTINLPSLAVWYQAKTASKSQVLLKGLYTIYQSMINDFYYNAITQAVQKLPPTNSTDFLNVFPDSYYTKEDKQKIAYDKNFGLYGQNNALFVRAVLTHPSSDSKFLMDYWGFTELEMKYFKNYFESAKYIAFKNDSNFDLAVKQWLDLSVNFGESISTQNSTANGFYLEYGAYLKFIVNNTTSKLTYEQAKNLMFNFNDIGRKPKIDDSLCLINKKNLDIIFSLDESDAVNFINNALKINNNEEAKNIFGYLNYVFDDVALGKFRGGNGATAAVSDLLSAALFQIFNNIGWDTYFGLMKRSVYENIFANKTCEDVIKSFSLSDYFNSTIICENQGLNTTYHNSLNWVQGVLYKDQKFLNLINSTLGNNMTSYQVLELTGDNSQIVIQFADQSNKIFQTYGVKGNYKAMDLTPLAVAQWFSANLTSQVAIEGSNSIKNWNTQNYKVEPEFSNFAAKYNYSIDFSLEDFLQIANFDGFFSGRWISDMFIANKNTNQTNPFASKPFIQYLRYVMYYEVLGLFTRKSIKDLLWGYEDDLLKIIKSTNYFLGGDPTLDTTFSLLNNMTSQPDDENIWTTYTGVGDSIRTREYKSVSGMREPYFDGEKISWRYRNPWKAPVNLNGTDALSFFPDVRPESHIWGYIDDLYRTASFTYNSTKRYNKLKYHRFILTENTIFNKTMNPYNDVYYCDKYNGMGNLTSVLKVPMFASKPNYTDCDNIGNEKPTILRAPMNHSEPSDDDDITLYHESWVDIEPYSGACLRAAQKLMISAHIEHDELFDIDTKFLPIYYVFRTGNFTEASVQSVLGDLLTGLTFKLILQILGVCLTTLFIALMIFSLIKLRLEGHDKVNEERLLS